ncbi:MAG: cupin domain-containing protein [Haloferacaceae archaeon]
MQQINISELSNQLAEDGARETEAMREAPFSLQVMRFEPGDEDPMHAHAEEEIYHVDAGTATLATEDGSIAVEPGDVVHLDPGTDHQFTDFEDEFVVTVVYAPAEGSRES